MAMGGRGTSANTGLLAARSTTVGIARLLFTCLSTVSAAPLGLGIYGAGHEEEHEAEGADKLVLLVVSLGLVLLGGAFAGLTIALMGQDGIYLQVLSRDFSDPQQRNAKRVYKLLKRGKHWVLVTLLLSNVVVNETLPVVLDRCLGGGVAAVVGSTVLIVIFGEVIPQSLCVRYGLQIGGAMAKPVMLLMYATAPLSWPTAKLLDKLLGEDHGTVYKKSGLKTLVTLHKTLGDVSERLNQDEVTIISAVLDLKDKPVKSVMTPMNDVFVLSEDNILDEETMDIILSAGYSRIPVHESGNETNFVGMLLVKILITYDPEDCKLVRDFPLATLPETRPETSCLDIVNFFQEGKSHMVLVSEYPGEDHGAIGVVTLEDVIEELIGEEIIDESDVYIDVHKAIRRLAPAPKAKARRRLPEDHAGKMSEEAAVSNDREDAADTTRSEDSRPRRAEPSGQRPELSSAYGSSPKATTFMMRRSSTGLGGDTYTAVPVRANIDQMREHLKHLGPSNRANNPKDTKSTTVKIKPGARVNAGVSDGFYEAPHQDDETTGLLSAEVSGKDGIQELQVNYGSVNPHADHARSFGGDSAPVLQISTTHRSRTTEGTPTSARSSRPYNESSNNSEENLPRDDHRTIIKKTYVRSGSITENVIESRGVTKVVLETSSNDEDDSGTAGSSCNQRKLGSKGSLALSGTDESDAGQQSLEGANASTTQEQSTSQGTAGPSSGSGNRKKQKKKKRKHH